MLSKGFFFSVYFYKHIKFFELFSWIENIKQQHLET